ncbi:MAG: TolC family protein [Rhodanobacteraceae bacterium]
MRTSGGTASGDTTTARRQRAQSRNAGRAAVACAIATLLTACATYVPAPIDPVQSSQRFAARRLDAAELRVEVERAAPGLAADWPPSEWNRAQLLAVALTQNPELSVARAEIGAALAHETRAAESPNPTLGLQSEYARHEEDLWLYGLSFDFVVQQPGLRKLEIELARQETAGTRAALMQHTWAVRRTLIVALSDAEHARRRIELLGDLATAQDRLVDTQQQRVTAGEDTPTDLAIARAARIEVEQQQAQARSDAARAEAAIAAALGMPPAALDGVSIAWPDWGNPPALDAESLRSAREQALLSRADLAAAIGEYAQAENKLQQAIARQYPQFEFHPGYYWDHGIAKWPFDVGLTVPLFNRNRGEIAEATANRDVAGQRMLALQAQVFGEIEAAVRAEALARETVSAAQHRSDEARQQLEHAELALRLGATDRLERSSADIVALRAGLEVLQARADQQSARDALEDAVHVPLSGPELALAASAPADSGAEK